MCKKFRSFRNGWALKYCCNRPQEAGRPRRPAHEAARCARPASAPAAPAEPSARSRFRSGSALRSPENPRGRPSLTRPRGITKPQSCLCRVLTRARRSGREPSWSQAKRPSRLSVPGACGWATCSQAGARARASRGSQCCRLDHRDLTGSCRRSTADWLQPLRSLEGPRAAAPGSLREVPSLDTVWVWTDSGQTPRPPRAKDNPPSGAEARPPAQADPVAPALASFPMPLRSQFLTPRARGGPRHFTHVRAEGLSHVTSGNDEHHLTLGGHPADPKTPCRRRSDTPLMHAERGFPFKSGPPTARPLTGQGLREAPASSLEGGPARGVLRRVSGAPSATPGSSWPGSGGPVRGQGPGQRGRGAVQTVQTEGAPRTMQPGGVRPP